MTFDWLRIRRKGQASVRDSHNSDIHIWQLWHPLTPPLLLTFCDAPTNNALGGDNNETSYMSQGLRVTLIPPSSTQSRYTARFRLLLSFAKLIVTRTTTFSLCTDQRTTTRRTRNTHIFIIQYFNALRVVQGGLKQSTRMLSRRPKNLVVAI